MYHYKASEAKNHKDRLFVRGTIAAALLIFLGGLGAIIYMAIQNLNVQELITPSGNEIVNFQSIPLVIIMLPLVAAVLIGVLGRRWNGLRSIISIIGTCGVFLLIVSIYPLILQGNIHFKLANVLGWGLYFKIDLMAYFMLAMTGILWLMMLIYAHVYMKEEKKQFKFYLWASITFSSILGTILAEDFFTMFLFFEMMTFSSYFLFVYHATEEAISAGNQYIYMGIGGGLCILLAMILTKVYTGVTVFNSAAVELMALGLEKYVIGALFIIGFGIKGGMFPFHLWIPKTYTVTLTPVNIISSGIMMKIGAYGLLRVFGSLFMPIESAIGGIEKSLWSITNNIGFILIWLGIITMMVGVFMALQQGNMKKMLAYHSVSQMGYIIMGIGVASYLGEKGAMGFVGSLYHILNHTLFKVLLFMVVGAVYLKTKEINMYNLGGLWKKMPLTAALCLVAALGITGMPLFNGFASKSILHHAIDEAYAYGHYSFKYAEILFTLVSAGTVCSFIKLFSYVFLGKIPKNQEETKGDNLIMVMAMSGLAAIIIAIGIFPNFILDYFLIPIANELSFSSDFIQKYIAEMNFFHPTELLKSLKVYALGGLIFALGTKYHLFHLKLPKWLCIETMLIKPSSKIVKSINNGSLERCEFTLLSYDVIIYAYMLGGILFVLLRYTS